MFTDQDSSNGTKGAVHGATLVLVLMCGLYNFCAWLKRREPHLLVNWVVYLVLAVFECWQVLHHCNEDESC